MSYFSKAVFFFNGDDSEVTKIGEYSSDAKRGTSGSISKLLLAANSR